MAKLPSFQFYPGDWMKDPNLRRCSPAARGVWMDMLCLMFECEERGVLATGGVPWTDKEVAAAITGGQTAVLTCIKELLSKGVAHRNQSGALFSKRMVRDEQTRANGRQRQQKSRSSRSPRSRDGPSHGDVTPLSRSSSFSSSSSSSFSLKGNGSREVLETHTPLLSVTENVCVPKSKFDYETVRNYAYASHNWSSRWNSCHPGDKVDGIRNPEGWAVVAHRSGSFDELIQEYVDQGAAHQFNQSVATVF